MIRRVLTMTEQEAAVIAEKVLEYIACREVIRSGKGFCGGYGERPYEEGMRLPPDIYENDVEHMAHMAFLAILVSRYFPEILPPQWALRMVSLALTHDVPEYKAGDKANDGQLKQAVDVERERKEMKRFMQGIDFGSHPSIYCDYLLLEGVTGLPMPDPTEDQLFGQLAYMLDKVTAIFELAYSESKGIIPTLTHKLEHYGSISDRDQFYMKVTKTDRALDNWMAHMYDYCKSYPSFWAIRMIGDAAYYQVRKEEPNWTYKVLANTSERLWPADRE